MGQDIVTGAAGFIGYHLCNLLLRQGDHVFGIDNLNDYYGVQLKRDRVEQLSRHDQFEFEVVDIADREATTSCFEAHASKTVLHLAAQAGVRHSLNHPHSYVDSNVLGFLNVLEACRHFEVSHLVYASSSSVYGANTEVPFAVEHRVDRPINLYAATKRANELMAYSYSHLFGLRTTGLRFFTVYGPWGRPDMAYYSFTKAILAGDPIDVYNHGNVRRDFTYVDDVTSAILQIIDRAPANSQEDETMDARYRLYNIGGHRSVTVEHFIGIIEQSLGKSAKKRYLPAQPGDVEETYADITNSTRDFGFEPKTTIEEGIPKFVDWYREYHGAE